MFTVGAGQGVSVSQDPAVKKKKKLLLNKTSPGTALRHTSAACLERGESHAAPALVPRKTIS